MTSVEIIGFGADVMGNHTGNPEFLKKGINEGEKQLLAHGLKRIQEWEIYYVEKNDTTQFYTLAEITDKKLVSAKRQRGKK